jgi:hypothetical protein
MAVGFYRERLIPALVNAAIPGRLGLRVITLRVGQGDSLQELREIPVPAGIQHQVPMIGHQAISQNAHGHETQALFHDGEKILVMGGCLEKPGTKVRAVQDVVNHAANINAPDSAHDGILTHHSGSKKVPDTFFLP